MTAQRRALPALAAVLAFVCSLGAADGVADAVESEPSEVIRIHGLATEEIARLRLHHDFWGIDWRAGYAVFGVTPEQRAELRQAGFELEIDSLRQAELDRWSALDHGRAMAGDPDTVPGFGCYRSVARTHADLQALAAEFPDRVRWVDIGDTWQSGGGNAPGDSIFALVIANQSSPHSKAPLVVMAAQHARELATAEIATRLAERIVRNPENDPDLAWLADHREIHIIAQQNPDGRRQVEQGAGLWRKNHNETACPAFTPGVDLNRNSPFLWGNGSSGNACSEVYRGDQASSEPETRAVQDYLATVFQRQRPGDGLDDPAPDDAEGLFVSLHSFSELVLLPWDGLGGQNENNAPNHDQLTILGRRFGFLTDYAVGRWQLLPPAGGTMTDFAYAEFGVASYTFEVGTTFMQSCDSFEATLWPVNFQALKLAAKAARRPFLEPAGPAITALSANLENGRIRITGVADDTRYFRGNVTEPPTDDPIAEVVEIRITAGLPESAGGKPLLFAIDSPASVASFEFVLPDGVTLPVNGRLFASAVDSLGRTGLPRVVELAERLLFADGFE